MNILPDEIIHKIISYLSKYIQLDICKLSNNCKKGEIVKCMITDFKNDILNAQVI